MHLPQFMIPNYLGFKLIFVSWDYFKKKVKFSIFKTKGYKNSIKPYDLTQFSELKFQNWGSHPGTLKNIIPTLI
jgi:hypothetical protein